MRTLRVLALGIGVTLLAGCRSATEPKAQLLHISTGDIGLTLQNPNPWPVFYIAVDPTALIAIDYAPCNDPSTCPHVPPGGSVNIAYHDVAGYHVGTMDIVVTQWLLQRNRDGSYSGTNIQSIRVTVPRTT
jgi:hypothetical protein